MARIALFKSEEADFQAIVAALGRHAQQIELVHSVAELAALRGEDPPVSALLLPVRISRGLTAPGICVQVKAHPTLCRIPVICIAPSKDRAILEALYGAGADTVTTLPLESEQLLLQIDALSRSYQSIDEAIAQQKDSVLFSSGSIQALDACPTAIVVIDSSGQCAFLNAAAKALLHTPPQMSQTQMSELIAPLILQANAPLPASRPVTLISAAQQQLAIVASYFPLLGEQGHPVGTAVHLSNSAELEHLHQSLLCALRSQSLALLSACGMLKYLEQKAGTFSLTPIQRFTAVIAAETLDAPLNLVLTSLVEVLDAIVPPSVNLKALKIHEAKVALRSSDLFQLLGHIILHAVQQIGIDGVISISSEIDPDRRSEVTLLCSAEHGSSRARISKDLVREALSYHSAAQSVSSKLQFGLAAAQTLADKYQLRIEYKDTPTATKVRLKLPLTILHA